MAKKGKKAQAKPGEERTCQARLSSLLLDSPDHRSHMVDSVRPENALKDKCPSTHPYPVPMLQTNVEFPIPPGTRGKVTLSSGEYSTMHADFFNAWDQARLKHLVDTCLNNEPFTASYPKPEECF